MTREQARSLLRQIIAASESIRRKYPAIIDRPAECEEIVRMARLAEIAMMGADGDDRNTLMNILAPAICPICHLPAHAAESDDLDRHPECVPGASS